MNILSLTYDITGAVLETVALSQNVDGSWAVVTLDGAGDLVSTREPSEQELLLVAPAVEGVAEPVTVDEAAVLRAQVAALTEANAAQAASTAALNAELAAKLERLHRILAVFQG